MATDYWRRALDEFVALLEMPNSLEREWQRLFVEHPFILTSCLPLGIEPKRLIACKPGRPEADFYFYPNAQDGFSSYGVIEIKRPKMKIVRTPRKNLICLSADATTAFAQAKKYAADLKNAVCRTASEVVLVGNPLHVFVIAGLYGEIVQKVTNEMFRSQAENLLPLGCMLMPFDLLANLLASKVPPRILMLVPRYPGIKEPIGKANRGGRDFGPRQMHVAICTDCGKKTAVPFKPLPSSPVYCRDCYGNRRRY